MPGLLSARDLIQGVMVAEQASSQLIIQPLWIILKLARSCIVIIAFCKAMGKGVESGI